jgi:nucleotide-binding universal stress UspA family protein
MSGEAMPQPYANEAGTDGAAVVVAGYDGSPPSRDALAWAAGAARRSGGRLVVVFVIAPVPAVSAATPVAFVAAEAQVEQAGALVGEVAQELEGYGVSWEFVVAQGDPADELERVADAYHADVVIVGRSLGVHILARSVPRRLLHRAHRPLLVVP